MAQTKPVTKSFWIKLVMIPLAMFGFAFALVPLYDILCDVTGFNGRTTNSSYQNTSVYEVDESRIVTVGFTASVAAGFPVSFKPKVSHMDVVPGKVYTMMFLAENRSNEFVVGQAVPSVAPSQAATHFKKLECFCFTRQEFKAHEPVEMPVRFVVEPDLDGNVQNITLSYNFFRIKPDA
ncbi:cytochrome c oxidase assembly protein [Leucothrix arctica]|uniref:Cytochrome c oxidase assembly protein CtaG n=1 Tax=Leucothrix arctica TaxID=1481894 RepID=A0A317CK33_9GAMM|nr:cytochrome c oxidase assembly protein [Leucothrix arctica]PWQ98944.1 cytochrome c oxidase assembly protein [Leucothrix arctica]